MVRYALGAGKRFYGKNWIHVDGDKTWSHIESTDISLDDVECNSVDLIYACHLLSYFNKGETNKLLEGWRLALKTGGVLRIATPDYLKLHWLYETYHDLDIISGPLHGLWKMEGEEIVHKSSYDFTKLCKVLEEAGFKNVQLYDWRQTEHAHVDDHSQAFYPHMNKENGMLISLNVECRK